MVEGVDVSLMPFLKPSDCFSKPNNIRRRTVGAIRRSTQGGWTEEEDEKLVKAVQQFGGKNWKKIAEAFPSRTDVQCLHRWQKVLNPKLVKGPWTREEDKLIMELVAQYGIKRWSFIAKSLPGRIGKQCRERWHNHLNPEIKKEAWTPQEELLLIQAHQKYGNRWAEIAKFLPGRADNSIKNHWNCSLKKRLSSISTSDGFSIAAAHLKKDELKSGFKEVDTSKHCILHDRRLLSSTVCFDQHNPFKIENFMELPHIEADSSNQSILKYNDNSMISAVTLDHLRVDNRIKLQPLIVDGSRYFGINNQIVVEDPRWFDAEKHSSSTVKCFISGVNDHTKSLNCNMERIPCLSSPTDSSCNNHGSEISCQGSSVLYEDDSTHENSSDLRKYSSINSKLLLSLNSPCFNRTPQTEALKPAVLPFSDKVGVCDTDLVLRTPQTSACQKRKSCSELWLQLNNETVSCLEEDAIDVDNNCMEKESPMSCSTPTCLSLSLPTIQTSPLSILKSAAKGYKNTPSIFRKRRCQSPSQLITDSQEDECKNFRKYTCPSPSHLFTDSQEDKCDATRSNGSFLPPSSDEFFKQSPGYEYLPQNDKTRGSGIGPVSADKFLYPVHGHQRAKLLHGGKSIEKKLELEFDKHL